MSGCRSLGKGEPYKNYAEIDRPHCPQDGALNQYFCRSFGRTIDVSARNVFHCLVENDDWDGHLAHGDPFVPAQRAHAEYSLQVKRRNTNEKKDGYTQDEEQLWWWGVLIYPLGQLPPAAETNMFEVR